MKVPYFIPTFLTNQSGFINAFEQHPDLLRTEVYSTQCTEYLSSILNGKHVYLTKSCTAALELSAGIINIQPGDEIILPSFHFVSAANAFVQKGAFCRFVDIDPHTLNLDIEAVANAITPRTKAVVTVNYAGVGCTYDALRKLCNNYGIVLVEDNAHGLGSKQGNTPLGGVGDISVLCFDALKPVTCSEGGAIIVQDAKFVPALETQYEFGTNKKDFIRGSVNRYEWVGTGSNYKLAEMLAASLWVQLQALETITSAFRQKWDLYRTQLTDLQDTGCITLPCYKQDDKHNGPFFFLITRSRQEQIDLTVFLRQKGIATTSHYQPLHQSIAGKKHGAFCGEDRYTSSYAERLIRLPLYFSLSEDQIVYTIRQVYAFYGIPSLI